MSDIYNLLNKTVVVKRRPGGPSGSSGPSPASVNDLGEPEYGEVNTWETVYAALKCRIEITKADIAFTPAGERVPPQVVTYTNDDSPLLVEDRIIDDDNEYIVHGEQIGYDFNGSIHHFEYQLSIT